MKSLKHSTKGIETLFEPVSQLLKMKVYLVMCHASPAFRISPRRFLSVIEVARAVQMLEDGATQRTVAERFGVSRSIIARLWTRFQDTGRYSRRPGQGRQRITSDREDRYLCRLARTGRQSSARRIQMTFQEHHGRRLSTQTVSNRLHQGLLRSRRPATGPILTMDHRVIRLDFAREHQNWGWQNATTDWEALVKLPEIDLVDGRIRQSRRITAADDGTIEVQSEPGGGSEFVVTFPKPREEES